MRLLCYISQRQQSQGQKKPSNNTISVITYLNDIPSNHQKKLNLIVDREPIKSSLDHETVTAERVIDGNPKENLKW